MSKLLQINSSVFADQGVSSQLADGFVAAWRQRHPDGAVTRRDLASEPVSHFSGDLLGAVMTAAEERSAEQQALVSQADSLIAELQEADLLVLGAPMYNFSVPSQLKAWFDHVIRAGVTFRYTESGPEGLLEGKKAVVFTSRGGIHRDQPDDSVVPFVTCALNLIGITDIEFVYAEGLAMGEDSRNAAIEEAEKRIKALIA